MGAIVIDLRRANQTRKQRFAYCPHRSLPGHCDSPHAPQIASRRQRASPGQVPAGPMLSEGVHRHGLSTGRPFGSLREDRQGWERGWSAQKGRTV